MSWKPEVDELNQRRENARKLGGQKGIDYQHKLGKYTVRERVDKLLDPGTFRELGMIAGSAEYDDAGDFVDSTPSNAIMGRGTVDGVKVMVSADDFTIRGGSSEATISDKWSTLR